MNTKDFSQIQNKLVVEEKYSVIHSAMMTADILNYYSDEVKNTILMWANNQDVSSTTLNGFTVKDIMDEIGCSEFMALCVLQSISVNPNIFADAVLVLNRDEVK